MLYVQESKRGVIALERIKNCGIKGSLNYTVLFKKIKSFTNFL